MNEKEREELFDNWNGLKQELHKEIWKKIVRNSPDFSKKRI